MRRLLLLLLLVGGCIIVGLVWLTDGLSLEPDRSVSDRQASRSSKVTAPAAAPGGTAIADPCGGSPDLAQAAAINAASVTGSQWSVFGRAQTGWSVYLPLISRELGVACPPGRTAFARRVKLWQSTHGLPASGLMTADTLRTMNLVWLRRRPFVGATREGACPPPPDEGVLATAHPDEGYRGKTVRLLVEALVAYRRMIAAARDALPALSSDRNLLTIVSGFRGPDEEASKCLNTASCGTSSMAKCSAHRTGLALDLFLGPKDSSTPTSSDDGDRALQSRSPAYLWLVANADQFGFTPYPFEPWHWEYTRPLASG